MTKTISDLMRKKLITIEKSASVQEAAKKMMDKNIGSLVVVDENSRPIGLVTERDLVRKVCIQDALPPGGWPPGDSSPVRLDRSDHRVPEEPKFGPALRGGVPRARHRSDRSPR